MKLKDKLEIIPYGNKDTIYNLSDAYLGQVFRRIVLEGTMQRIFYDGSVKNTTDFIDFIKREDCSVFFVKFRDEDVGFFWLTSFIQKSAFITYCFYKEFWGKDSLNISQACLGYIFQDKNDCGEHVIDVLLGLTPSNNKLAINFLKKNGMTILGYIPVLIKDYRYNKTHDGVLSYITREKFEKLSSRSPKSYLAFLSSK